MRTTAAPTPKVTSDPTSSERLAQWRLIDCTRSRMGGADGVCEQREGGGGGGSHGPLCVCVGCPALITYSHSPSPTSIHSQDSDGPVDIDAALRCQALDGLDKAARMSARVAAAQAQLEQRRRRHQLLPPLVLLFLCSRELAPRPPAAPYPRAAGQREAEASLVWFDV